MNVAVTGATGFVGSHLVDALCQRGDVVGCLARSPAKAERLAALGCRVVRGDLDDAPALAELVRDAEAVYHLAGRLSAHSERDYYRVNCGGTERVALAARGAGVRRFLYVSSLAATGPGAPGRPVDDATPPRPISAYGRSKLAAEDALWRSGVPATVVRPPIVYGPRDREVLKLFRLAARGVVPLMGDGRQELSLIHVEDLARALIAAATAAQAGGKAYHAAHPEIVTQRQMVEALGRAVGREARAVALPLSLARGVLWAIGTAARLGRVETLFTLDKASEFVASAWTCTSTGLQRDADWRPRIGHADGFEMTARWYREAGWL